VLALSLSEGRVLLTFDKDFGEAAFRLGRKATAGVILLRPRLRSPEQVSKFLIDVRSQQIDWEGHFSVVKEHHVRVVELPK
jgi:predicted nuclease of predicted toxin-antitoxin system